MRSGTNNTVGTVGATLATISGLLFVASVASPSLLHHFLPGWLVLGYLVGTLIATVLCVGSLIFEQARLVAFLGLLALAVLENYFFPVHLLEALPVVFTWSGTLVIVLLVGCSIAAMQKLRQRAR